MKGLFRTGMIVILICFLPLIISCSNKDGAQLKVKVYEVTHSVFYAPQYVAISKGFFEEEGLSIELTNGGGGDKTMTALLSDAADIVLVGVETSIYVNLQGTSDPPINFAQLTQTDGTFLVSRTQIDNFSWDLLKGKVMLGQRKGGMPEMVGEYTLKKNGIIPFEDVEIIQNVEFNNLGPAFVSGTGDFVQLFEPVASQLEVEGKGYVVASMGIESGNLPYTAYITKQSTIKNRAEMIQKFTNAIYKAQLWVQAASNEEILEALKPHFPGVEENVMLKVIERYKSQGSWAQSPILDEAGYHHLEEIMEGAGELKDRVPYDKIVDNRFAQKAIDTIHLK